MADARFLPLPQDGVDSIYSYSVLQHFSHQDAAMAIAEMGRVLKRGGIAKVQMPTRFGLRCLYHQARRGFRTAIDFEVRYWTIGALAEVFARHIGDARFEVDGYFGIGLQPIDEPLMTPVLRRVLQASERLKAISRRIGPLTRVADSVFVEATARG